VDNLWITLGDSIYLRLIHKLSTILFALCESPSFCPSVTRFGYDLQLHPNEGLTIPCHFDTDKGHNVSLHQKSLNLRVLCASKNDIIGKISLFSDLSHYAVSFYVFFFRRYILRRIYRLYSPHGGARMGGWWGGFVLPI